MGSTSDRHPLTWRLIDILLLLLDSGEREIVHGDLAECSLPANDALRDVSSLVLRRQLALWSDWRSWLVFVCLILPLSILVSVISRRTADLSSIYLWMYANNWHWGDVRTVGFWQVLAETAAIVLISQLALICSAWSGGFVVGSISRARVQRKGILLFLSLCFGLLIGAPLYGAFYGRYIRSAFAVPLLSDANAPVFAVMFYREILPLVEQTIFVLLPALSGLRRGEESARLGDVSRGALLTMAAAALLSMVVQSPDLWMLLKIRPWLSPGWPMQIIVFWPMGYLLLTVMKHRGHKWSPHPDSSRPRIYSRR